MRVANLQLGIHVGVDDLTTEARQLANRALSVSE